MDNWRRREACMSLSSAWFMGTLLSSSFHCTSNCFFPSVLTIERFGKFSLKNCSVGVGSCSLLNFEQSKCNSVSKCSISTSRIALIAALCRSTVKKRGETQKRQKYKKGNKLRKKFYNYSKVLHTIRSSSINSMSSHSFLKSKLRKLIKEDIQDIK